MKHFALIAMTLALGLTACGPDRPPPPPPPPASAPTPPPPPPAPPPGGITITGTVTSVAGRCNRIAADGGQSYAVVGLAMGSDQSITVGDVRNGHYVDAVSGDTIDVSGGSISFRVLANSAGVGVQNGPGRIGDPGPWLR